MKWICGLLDARASKIGTAQNPQNEKRPIAHMDKPPNPSTPQFRTALIRKLKNIEPDYDVEIFDRKRGVAFRMIDKLGHPRSGIVSLFVNRGHALDRSNLKRRIRAAGFPKFSED
jgi:hypothetical protein